MLIFSISHTIYTTKLYQFGTAINYTT